MPTIPLKLQDNLIASIARRIISGELPSGAVLTEDELTRTYNLSRTVVREAIKRLTTLGLVTSRPKVGTIIRPREDWQMLHPDVLQWVIRSEPDLILQMVELWRVASPGMTRLAAEKGNDEDRAAIRKAYERLEYAFTQDHDDLQAADEAFHDTIVNACKNELLVSLVRQMRDSMTTSRIPTKSYQGLDLGDRDAVERILAQFRRVRDAILSGNGNEAAGATASMFFEAQERMRRQERRFVD